MNHENWIRIYIACVQNEIEPLFWIFSFLHWMLQISFCSTIHKLMNLTSWPLFLFISIVCVLYFTSPLNSFHWNVFFPKKRTMKSKENLTCRHQLYLLFKNREKNLSIFSMFFSCKKNLFFFFPFCSTIKIITNQPNKQASS